MSAQYSIKRGEESPYHGEPPKDWAERAALGVISDLLGRRGIKWEFEKVDEDVRPEIVERMAEIIRLCNPTDVAIEAERYRQMLLTDLRDKIQGILDSLEPS